MSTSNQQPSTDIPLAQAEAPNKTPHWDGEGPPTQGRFDIEILSVYYYPEEDSVCAAVVLKTSFVFEKNQKLKRAKCPIAISAKNDKNEALVLGILDYHPPGDEHVQVDYRKRQVTYNIDPSIDTSVGGGRLGSYTTTRSDEKAILISLRAVNRQTADPQISWYYDDNGSKVYPGMVEVLLIIQHPEPVKPWFEFELRLTSELWVDVHGLLARFTDFKDRLVGVHKQGENGWCFKILGKYKEDYAKKVLQSLDTSPIIGLKAAAQSLLNALMPP